MHRAVVPRAGLHASSRVVDIVAGGTVVGMANANPARCTQQSVLTVAMRHKCLSSHEKIGLCIAVTVTRRSRKTRVAAVAVDRAGNLYEPDQSEPR